MKKNEKKIVGFKKKLIKKQKRKKKETAQPFTVDCYGERLSSFSIFIIYKENDLLCIDI
jgi:hypothetical protein